MEVSLKMLPTDFTFRNGMEKKGSGNVNLMKLEKKKSGEGSFSPMKHNGNWISGVLVLHSQSLYKEQCFERIGCEDMGVNVASVIVLLCMLNISGAGEMNSELVYKKTREKYYLGLYC